MPSAPEKLSAQSAPARVPLSLLTALGVGLWFGLVAGLVEGAGLIFFQHVNWARWGPMIHVSLPILWISPLVDAAFFIFLSVLVWLASHLARRMPGLRVLVFLLSFLTVYDWLTVTGRLLRIACVLFALGAAAVSARRFARHHEEGVRLLQRSLIAVLALFLAVFAGTEGSQWLHERSAVESLPAAAAGAPNVLVIVVDTLRADHVSAYGYSRHTTPNIDLLASQGVLFENAIAPSSWSLPSHVSLVTGRYLHDHGVGNVQREPWLGWGKSGLGGFPTIGEALAKDGYRTGAFSANRTYFSHDLGFGRSFIHFEDYFSSTADAFVRTLYGREFSRLYLKRSDKSLVKRVLRRIGWTSLLDQDAEGSGSYGGAFGIRKHADAVNAELLHWIDNGPRRPFFAFLNYFDVHDPYGGPRSYAKPGWAQQTDTDIDRYDDGVRYADDCLGQLMAALQQRGAAANTLVIVTSDHGESLGQHYLMTHGRALYYELIHVPLVIWYPGHIGAATRVATPVSNAAIPATILDLLGQPPDASFGFGLGTAWRTGSSPLPPPLSELAQNKYSGKHDKAADALIPTASSGEMASVVTSRWHFILHQTLGAQIYDWGNDPAEAHNLIDTPEGKSEAEQLKLEMKKAVP